MKPFLKSIVFLSCFSILVSCSTHTSKIAQAKKQQTIQDSLCSPGSDSLFLLKNIKSSLFKVDSAIISRYVPMDTIQKMHYLTAKIIDSENPDVMIVGQTYINQYVNACFISKQDNIGDIQPIIVSASGDDYHALYLLLLDKKNKLVAHILLSGGLEGGPDGETDDFILLHQRESILNNDEVLTYVLKIKQSKKDTLPSIDSISYLRKIMPDGTLKILKKDSSRYFRKINWPNHYW